MSKTRVGKLNKSFGVNGMIKVVPTKAFSNDLKSCDVWFVERGGEQIPYFVERIEEEPHFLVKFEDVDSPEKAKMITGCALYLRDKDVSIAVKEDESDLDKLVGFEVINEEIVIGVISQIEEYPQQLMAIISTNKDDVLMPLTSEYIKSIEVGDKKLYVGLPDGFLESQK